MFRKSILVLFCISNIFFLKAERKVSLNNDSLSIEWIKLSKGWRLNNICIGSKKEFITDHNSFGQQTIIFSSVKPDILPKESFLTNKGAEFPEKVFKYPKDAWESNISEVSLNTVGIKRITPSANLICKNPVTFLTQTDLGTITSVWTLEQNYIKVTQTFKANKTGYFSVSTPTIFSTKENEVDRAVIPGYLNAESISSDFVSAYGYGHYIPNRPVIFRDRCATTPISILSTGNYTVGVSPEEKYPRLPYTENRNTHKNWNVGLSIMNPQSVISPTLYYPVLGQEKSFLKKNDTLTFEYRYIVSKGNWYDVFKKCVYGVFEFDKQKIAQNSQSLISRVFQMYKYVTNTKTSRFRIATDDSTQIGAQDYLGGVAGSDNDAMKNSDYGAMWMLATLTQDTLLTRGILPYARNFKLKQLYTTGDFKGAIRGQYYLWKSNNWVEEWGQHVEPIGVTYYALADMGNILLFNPSDKEVYNRFCLAADYLLKNQLSDGSWEIGYEKSNKQPIYTDLKDLRPTFYGLLIAYKILNEQKYLDGAIRGADWFVKNAVNTGKFIGVCGDTRFSPDFATSQSVQILLEMYRQTRNEKYKDAAIQTAKYYTTYIYTFPNGLTDIQKQGKQVLPAWGLSQSGLCFEQAGTIGSANSNGPILLASHAAMFVRIFQLTHDSLFIDMARAAVNGKDGFVDKATGVASYYWSSFDNGAGSFPHHAWWQIGWIMDYLMAEAEMRSNNVISFPRGFITPKVGPHQTIGFESGLIYGKKATLVLIPNLIRTNNPLCDYLTVVSGSTLYILAMNSCSESIDVEIAANNVNNNFNQDWKKEFGKINIEPYGLKILSVEAGQ